MYAIRSYYVLVIFLVVGLIVLIVFLVRVLVLVLVEVFVFLVVGILVFVFVVVLVVLVIAAGGELGLFLGVFLLGGVFVCVEFSFVFRLVLDIVLVVGLGVRFILFGELRLVLVFGQRRITSYNVCYTKLLRVRLIPGNPFPYPSL